MGRLAERLAAQVGCPPIGAALVGLAAQLHDLGKISLPREITAKPDPLTPQEWKLLKSHTSLGQYMLPPGLDFP